MSLPLHTRGSLFGGLAPGLYKVLPLGEALDRRFCVDRTLVDLRGGPPAAAAALRALGFAGVVSDELRPDAAEIGGLACGQVVASGDVVRIGPSGRVSVLFRRGAKTNFLFATERCNSLCLMCSQPPREVDDGWRVQEILDTLALADRDVPAIGLTGGEPTLLGAGLARIIAAAKTHLPQAQFNVLTNARRLADRALADVVTADSSHVLWAVPLYADTAARHDYVVQARGAFAQTLQGLYNLAERQQAVEIRCVVHKATVGRLVQLAEFIWRNYPVAAHVAFMGLEPMGFAKANRDLLYIDPLDYRDELERAAWHLHDRGMAVSIYNTPLCVLSPTARVLARKSISDWKNDFAPECEGCRARPACSGFFSSAGPQWRSRGIQPISEGEEHAT